MNSTKEGLVVGINECDDFSSLRYAESDAAAIAVRLAFHGDDGDDRNFDVMRMFQSTVPVKHASRCDSRFLLQQPRARRRVLLAGTASYRMPVVVFVTADGIVNDYGITMDELYIAAERSEAKSVLLLLDCCHAGAIATFRRSATRTNTSCCGII